MKMENKKYKTTFTAAKVSRRSDEGYHKQYIQEKESQSDQAACLWIFRKKGRYFYHTVLPGSGFSMEVEITGKGLVKATVIDAETNEPYTLHLTDSASGSFITGVKMDYEQVLTDIAEHCFEPDVFKGTQTKAIIAYVRETYGDELEFLWAKTPDNAIWRRKDTQKWYAAVLTVSRSKLGLPSDEMAEIIDLRIEPEQMEATVDNKKYFPGWHMNKRSWYTIILDGSVPEEEIYNRIDRSYRLATK